MEVGVGPVELAGASAKAFQQFDGQRGELPWIGRSEVACSWPSMVQIGADTALTSAGITTTGHDSGMSVGALMLTVMDTRLTPRLALLVAAPSVLVAVERSQGAGGREAGGDLGATRRGWWTDEGTRHTR